MDAKSRSGEPDHCAARRRVSGALLVAASAAGFGAMPIFARLAYAQDVDTFGILLPRFALAAVCLAVLARVRRSPWPPRRGVLALALLGGVGYVGQSMLYFTALAHASAGLVALLLYAFPFIVAVLAAAFLHERLRAGQVAALGVAAGGLALTIGGGQGSPLGISLALGAALVYSVYIVGGARVMRATDPLAASAVVCTAAALSVGAVTLGRLAAGMPVRLPQDPAAGAAVLAIALVSTVFAITAFLVGLKWLGASVASVISTLEPVVSVVLGALVLGEPVGVAQAAGGAIVVGTAAWLALSQRRG
jgi:drug/metabolite transporter (DMT)-like permease